MNRTVPPLPPVVRVSAFDVRIVEWDFHAAAVAQRFGDWSPLEMQIRVDVSVDPMKVLDTLLHELNHAVFWAQDFAKTDKEERLVGILATTWAQIFRDNPPLLTWIAEVVSRYQPPTPVDGDVFFMERQAREYARLRADRG